MIVLCCMKEKSVYILKDLLERNVPVISLSLARAPPASTPSKKLTVGGTDDLLMAEVCRLSASVIGVGTAFLIVILDVINHYRKEGFK